MASGLQCPGCGHVHPAGLPEIARGDATFRCYGCYRTLSVPEGWTGRPTPRSAAPEISLTGDAPPGAGTRDARSSRLAGRGRSRASALTGPPPGAPPDLPTQMVPEATPDGHLADFGEPPSSWTTTGAPSRTGRDRAGTGRDGVGPGSTGMGPGSIGMGPGSAGAAGRIGSAGGDRPVAAPLGWVATRRTGTPLPAAIRAGVWAGAFAVGLAMTAFILRKMGILDVNRVIDLYAGTGPGRFAVLLLLLPMWALLSATIAHVSLEALAKRRRPRSPGRTSTATRSKPPADTTAPG